MEKSKYRQIIVSGVIGFLSAFSFSNRFLVMVIRTFHENYTYYDFLLGSSYLSLTLLIITTGYQIKMVYKQNKNKKSSLVSFFLYTGISFVVSYLIIGFVYSQIGII